MYPEEFPGCNLIIGAGQEEYKPLPAYGDQQGAVVICWKLTWREVLRVIKTRSIWHHVSTFGRGFQPQYLTTDARELLPEVVAPSGDDDGQPELKRCPDCGQSMIWKVMKRCVECAKAIKEEEDDAVDHSDVSP